MEFDADCGPVCLSVIVLLQPPANLARLHADDRIIPSGIANRPTKELHSYSALFKSFVVSLQPVMNYIRQELLTALAGLKNSAG